MRGITSKKVEEFLKLNYGALDHIPLYARGASVSAILKVRHLEKQTLFRQGLYYIVLADLCRSTEASLLLGTELNRLRIETFILQCVDALGSIDLSNYSLFVREIGDAVLILFSSFEDVYNWWNTMEQWIATSNKLWRSEIKDNEKYRHFIIQAKTIVHAGEVAYSGESIPLSYAVNQVFKVEKVFYAGELGCTQMALNAATPVVKNLLGISIKQRKKIILPGDSSPIQTYLIARSPFLIQGN